MYRYQVVNINLKGAFSNLENELNAYAQKGFRVVGVYYSSWVPGVAGHATVILEIRESNAKDPLD